MDATAEATQPATPKPFKSPARVLASFFQRSRDGWKRKYQELKATVKAHKVRIADLSKSRDKWRLKADQAGEQVSVLRAEIDALRTQSDRRAEEKKTTRNLNL
jgi:septal ring factor EnvC (AmiA/AmiB activator)